MSRLQSQQRIAQPTQEEVEMFKVAQRDAQQKQLIAMLDGEWRSLGAEIFARAVIEAHCINGMSESVDDSRLGLMAVQSVKAALVYQMAHGVQRPYQVPPKVPGVTYPEAEAETPS